MAENSAISQKCALKVRYQISDIRYQISNFERVLRLGGDLGSLVIDL
jgi:hypothetical protein